MKKMIPALAVAFGLALAAFVPTSTRAAPSTDTAACGKCGDGYCNPRCGETETSCPADCGGGPTS